MLVPLERLIDILDFHSVFIQLRDFNLGGPVLDKNEVVEVKTVKSFEKCIVLGKELTMYGTLENPLFLAKDVAEWIEYSKTSEGYYNVSKMLMTVDEDEKITITISNSDSGNGYSAKCLTEDGLYEVLMQSRKPIAKRFKKEVKRILKELRLKGESKIEKVPVQSQKTEAEIRNETRELINESNRIKLETAKFLKQFAEKYSSTNKTYEQVLDAYSIKEVIGQFVLPLPALEEKNWSATEVGQMLGISANMVGKIANELKIKTDEYGKWYVDKARYSNKEVNSFRYNQKGVDRIRERLNER